MLKQPNSPPEVTLSLSGVARQLDISYPAAIKRLADGTFKPDFFGPNKTALFRRERLPELRALLA